MGWQEVGQGLLQSSEWFPTGEGAAHTGVAVGAGGGGDMEVSSLCHLAALSAAPRGHLTLRHMLSERLGKR